MNRIYGEFKGRVLEGREERLKGEIESLAGGRVYTGTQALELGLVDRLGGFADAIKFAAAEAEISDYELRVFPKTKTIFDMMAELFGGKESDDQFVSLQGGSSGRLGLNLSRMPTLAPMIEAIKAVDPQKAKILQDFLVQLELFSSERVLLLGPGSTTLIR